MSASFDGDDLNLKSKKKNRILALKLRSHATIIQSRWRGAVLRRNKSSVLVQPKERPILRGLHSFESSGNFLAPIQTKIEFDIFQSSGNFSLPVHTTDEFNLFQSPGNITALGKTVEEFKSSDTSLRSNSGRPKELITQDDFDSEKISFRDIKSIKLCVDCASGLPMCCTGTRVSAMIIDSDKIIIDKDIPNSISLPQFDCTFPKYSLESVLKGIY